MAEHPLRILQVSTMDIGGGAEKVAWNLFKSYSEDGYKSWLAVGQKRSDDLNVFHIPNNQCRSQWLRFWIASGNMLSPLVGKVRGVELLRYWLHEMGQPKRFLRIQRGYENFYFPGTWQLLGLPRERPDIVHCHNLHGDYFDLRVLPWLSQKVPVVLTLHDAWLLSGHCAHSFDCERWKTGCGECPDLTISPAIKRDATAYNWKRKRDIFAKCRLYVATPCQWLMDRIQQSILAPAIKGAKVIHNGIPLNVFHPYDKVEARKELGLPLEAKILLFTANSIRRNIWKDYETLRAAMSKVTRSLTGKSILFLALGESAPTERIGKVEVRFIPYQTNPSVVARYYQAADIYTHAARIDTFPTTLLEALACGTPVVATAVGGIPEQIKDGVTGFLTPPGDDNAMAAQIERLLDDDGLRTRMGVQATKTVRSQFSIKRQVNEYLNWYKEILGA